MISLKSVLVPTDFSSFSRPAVDLACRLAEEFDGALHLLHVTEDFADVVPDFGMGINLQPFRDAWARSHDDRDAEVLARLSDVLDPAWTEAGRTRTVIRRGKPFVEIVRYAKEQEIDLIVMGTHGRSGLPHVMLGSVTENVVRQAPCPVLTARTSEHRFEAAT